MSNLLARILSAAVLVPLVLTLLFFSDKLVFVCFISLIAAISGFEFGSMVIGREARAQVAFISLMSASLASSVSLFFELPILLLLSVCVAFFLSFFLFMFRDTPFDISIRHLSFSFLGIFYCGFLAGFLGLIFCFHFPNGKYWLLLLMLGTFLGDTGAYAFGRFFGKRKMAPRLSPGKTWAGAIGGFSCTLSSVIFMKLFVLTDVSWFAASLLSLLLSFFCQVGDLAESFIKRSVGVKDSGRLIPGHGGLLDRIDALVFGAPVVFLFSAVHYIL